jgi:hypothetical protein
MKKLCTRPVEPENAGSDRIGADRVGAAAPGASLEALNQMSSDSRNSGRTGQGDGNVFEMSAHLESTGSLFHDPMMPEGLNLDRRHGGHGGHGGHHCGGHHGETRGGRGGGDTTESTPSADGGNDTTVPPTDSGSSIPTDSSSSVPTDSSSSVPTDSVPATPGMTAGDFTVSANGFTDANGQPWNMRGLNAGVQDALQGYPAVLNDFPSMTAIRLNVVPGQDSMADVGRVIDEYTAKGVVVMAEDHSGNGRNTDWYAEMARTYANNPLVMLETPNEPQGDVANDQIAVIQAIRSAGYTKPIGLQPIGGYDQSNIGTVKAATGDEGLFVTPHIYYNGTDPNGPAQYAANEVQGARDNGMFAAIDEFGDAADGYTHDAYGDQVTQSVIAMNQQQGIGAIYWAMDNWNHPDGADSALLNPDGSELTPSGTYIQQNWLG